MTSCKYHVDGVYRCVQREQRRGSPSTSSSPSFNPIYSLHPTPSVREPFVDGSSGGKCDPSTADVRLPFDNRTNCLDACTWYAHREGCQPFYGNPTQYVGNCVCAAGVPDVSMENRRCQTSDRSPIILSLPYQHVNKSCRDACSLFETLNGCRSGTLQGVAASMDNGMGATAVSSSDQLRAPNVRLTISHPDGRQWKYDERADVIRLNSGRPMVMTPFVDTRVYGSSEGRIGLADVDTGRMVRHAWMWLHLSDFSANNYDFAWFPTPSGADDFVIYNDYRGGHYIGYDSQSDVVLITNTKSTNVVSWRLSMLPPAGAIGETGGLCKCLNAADTAPRPPLRLKRDAPFLL